MAQSATILSVSSMPYSTTTPAGVSLPNAWSVIFQYNLDAGGLAQARILTGLSGISSTYDTAPPIVPFWASSSSLMPVPLSATPGTTNPVTLICPGVVQVNAFGLLSPTNP